MVQSLAGCETMEREDKTAHQSTTRKKPLIDNAIITQEDINSVKVGDWLTLDTTTSGERVAAMKVTEVTHYSLVTKVVDARPKSEWLIGTRYQYTPGSPFGMVNTTIHRMPEDEAMAREL